MVPMSNALPAQPTRYLRRIDERNFKVHDNGAVKGHVWCAAVDLAEGKRWRASTPDGGVEYTPWRFFPSPQAAARYCVEQHDRMTAGSRRCTCPGGPLAKDAAHAVGCPARMVARAA
jgi:hypothetical protein